MTKSSSGYPTPSSGFNYRTGLGPESFLTTGANALKPTTYTPRPHVSPPINPEWRKNPTTRIRRASRAQETSALHRARSLLSQPVEADIANNHGQWLLIVQRFVARLGKRADATRNLTTVAQALVRHACWSTSCTTSLTWERIGQIAGVSRSVVKRSLRLFWQRGYIARVAPGRSAKAKIAAGWSGDDARENDAPVYMLTLPQRPTSSFGPPPTTSGSLIRTTRAREGNAPNRAAARPSHLSVVAASGHRATPPAASPTGPLWPSYARATRKDERVQACREMQARVPRLRALSDRYLASLTRDFMLAGWTLRDVLHALDHLPDGRAQGFISDGQWVPYPGADRIPDDRLAHWVTFRLNHWRTQDGSPTESLSAKRERQYQAEETRRAARDRAAAESRARREAVRNDPATVAARQAAMAALRALQKDEGTR